MMIRRRKGMGGISKLIQTHLFPLHVIASPKGVAISSILGLLRRFTPRNDKPFNVFVLVME